MIGYLIRQNWHKQTIIILSAFPTLFSIALLTFYFHAAKILGHLPMPVDSDNPKISKIYHQYYPVILFLAEHSALLIPITLLSGLVFRNVVPDKKITRKLLLFLTVSYVVAIALAFSNLMLWFFD